ncbi:antiviral RADAR system adenosine triphosphatase RdrA [Pseudomonas sp. Leaf59]|uniref:antiviral RADAR system adenosine triphosphatase RdrA n=1 Tax=Pseudomonas sp. Leaf59 TaxID=2876556 RepID=UPI001E3E90CA|nr:antiviral RADAR system adenosine triphosphatase RdrA [Pseudomonas sp. Leaf59]
MTLPTVYFPINQREQASQASAKVLLASDVYDKLTETVKSAKAVSQRARESANGEDDVNIHRAHTAVLIDGSRGTGKSSVLVNISKYLAEHEPELQKRVHFLKPLDPTLLETTDDLFLNVIVAGLVCDPSMREAKDQKAEQATVFHEELQLLGNTLERLESQRELRGLDKLRAFMGNQNLAQQVHRIFKAALNLLDKDLLVLPIDDVDTSLNRAFDNLEVIRKYLVSPYVLPVISGDLELYNELTWRNFHGRLIKESNVESAAALVRAKDLAQEYQRKILPLQYRIEMPQVISYLKSSNIGFIDSNREPVADITMAHFHTWLEAILNERTNGMENSYLPAPVKNIRSLAQLVYSLQDEIPKLSQALAGHDVESAQLRRLLTLPILPAVMQAFKDAYSAAARIVDKSQNEAARRRAYQQLADDAKQPFPLHNELVALAPASQKALMKYCQFAAEGGAAYLALSAQHYWREIHSMHGRDEYVSVLHTPLFEPMNHNDISLRHFEATAPTTAWREVLANRAPLDWLERIPDCTLIPYPSPEPGYALTKKIPSFKDKKSEFVAALLLHRNFYTTNKRATLSCCGRVFELLVASFVKDVSADEISHVLRRAPFHSLGALASTKTQTVATDEDDTSDEDEASSEANDEESPTYSDQIESLSLNINTWRAQHNLQNHVPAPWFFYNVMNKVFNQAGIFNKPQSVNTNPSSNISNHISALAPKIFNSIWAAFGSFEKGELFGLPAEIAHVNVGDGKKFSNSELYTRNISPFYAGSTKADGFGKATGAYTYMIASHPLRVIMQSFADPKNAAASVKQSDETKPEISDTLLDYFNKITGSKYRNFQQDGIRKILMKADNKKEIIDHIRNSFEGDKHYRKFMAIAKMTSHTN